MWINASSLNFHIWSKEEARRMLGFFLFIYGLINDFTFGIFNRSTSFHYSINRNTSIALEHVNEVTSDPFV